MNQPQPQQFVPMNEYSKMIHDKANLIAREILMKLVENTETFVPMVFNSQEEVDKATAETYEFGNSIVEFLATKDIQKGYATFALDKLIENLEGLKIFVKNTIDQYEDEYLSRSIGLTNDQGKFRHQEASLAHLVLKLNDLRVRDGNKYPADYINDRAPAMPGMETLAPAAEPTPETVQETEPSASSDESAEATA